ncbi:MAG: hypothetical protein KF817_13625 [Phycisphaeraceae bacterium]|nr:hypothetical protein [Phycisphaeraceae bacterium]
MLLAAVHVHAAVTVPVLAVFVALSAWYLRSLRNAAYPRTQRSIRRFALLTLDGTAVLVVAGLSIVDPARHPGLYVVTWLAAMLFLLVAVGGALLDASVTVRLHGRALDAARAGALGGRPPASSGASGRASMTGPAPADRAPRDRGGAHRDGGRAR